MFLVFEIIDATKVKRSSLRISVAAGKSATSFVKSMFYDFLITTRGARSVEERERNG